MSTFMTFNEEATKAPEGNFTKIESTGIYNLAIETISIVEKGGYKQADIKFAGEDGQCMVYGAIWLENPDGTENKGSYKIHRLMQIAGVKSITTKKKILDLGDYGKKEVLSIPELEGVEVQAALVKEYSRYNGIKESMTLRNVYAPDEDVSSVADRLKDSYRDGLSPYDVEAETPDTEAPAETAQAEDDDDDIL